MLRSVHDVERDLVQCYQLHRNMVRLILTLLMSVIFVWAVRRLENKGYLLPIHDEDSYDKELDKLREI